MKDKLNKLLKPRNEIIVLGMFVIILSLIYLMDLEHLYLMFYIY